MFSFNCSFTVYSTLHSPCGLYETSALCRNLFHKPALRLRLPCDQKTLKRAHLQSQPCRGPSPQVQMPTESRGRNASKNCAPLSVEKRSAQRSRRGPVTVCFRSFRRSSYELRRRFLISASSAWTAPTGAFQRNAFEFIFSTAVRMFFVLGF